MADEYPINQLAEDILLSMIKQGEHYKFQPKVLVKKAVELSVKFHEEMEKLYKE